MILTTPIHDRTSAANTTGLWDHWAGYLVAKRYQLSEKFEYFAIRNSAGLFGKRYLTQASMTRLLGGVPGTTLSDLLKKGMAV
jgi:aminomethyltransferase